jgi:hypothetical protein
VAWAYIPCPGHTASKPGFYVDHWLGEYWKADEQRWVLFDSELGQDEREYCQVTIDTYDVPRDQFLVAGKAWQLCRAGQADPHCFGFEDELGEWFIQDSLVQDLAALNKMELLCWDGWGMAVPQELRRFAWGRLFHLTQRAFYCTMRFYERVAVEQNRLWR